MRRIAFIAFSIFTAVVVFLPTGARAQSFVTYISNIGAQSKNCFAPVQNPNLASLGPCSSFSQAINATSESGTLNCVDPLYDGGATINRSMTIDCLAGGGSANAGYFTINAPGKIVRIRNMGLALSQNGGTLPHIDIVAAAHVVIENVTISNNTGPAIYDRRTGPAKLTIKNTTITGSSGPAIAIVPQGGTTISAVLEGVLATGNNYGLAVANGARVLVKDSTFSGNTTTGVHSDPGGIIELENSLMSMNATGIAANAGSTVSISNSRINSNNTGISGATTSYGNNKFFANAVSDGTTPTPASLR